MTHPTISKHWQESEAFQKHQEACEFAKAGDFSKAQKIYQSLTLEHLPTELLSLIHNNQAALDALAGETDVAANRLRDVLATDPNFPIARSNLAQLNRSVLAVDQPPIALPPDSQSKPRIALISFLFNWPSSAGGIIHTIELARFLTRDGFDVTLIHPQFDPWQIGQVQDCPVPIKTIPFTEQEWNRKQIQRRFRQVVDEVDPDTVMITGCWNFKPHLVQALSGYRILLRMQAHECLCPLNNLRVKPKPDGGMQQCPLHQLVAPTECLKCLRDFGRYSGMLHQRDRALSEVESPDYQTALRESLQTVEAVLVLNPLIAEVLRPHCRRVEVVTWGMDAARFPEPQPRTNRSEPLQILFAGLPDEPIKGFPTLKTACARLWEKRQDWKLVVTGTAPANPEPFARYVGWQSQSDLPRLYQEADIVAVPTLVHDGLSRTVVESMASGRAVVASRLGAMPVLISEGVTGLLCHAGDAWDWVETLSRLLDDEPLREELGRNGRRLFCERFPWERVIERDYRSLLSRQSL